MSEETIGQLHDSLAPGESTYISAGGETWEIWRPEVPAACACPWNNGYARGRMAAHQHHVDCPQFADD